MAIIRKFQDKSPDIDPTAFLAESATLIGDVQIGAQANIWYGAVLRGDCGYIKIGARTNVQDLACVHMTSGVSNTEVGEDVTIGHGAILHGVKVGDRALIGMGAVLLDNVEIGQEAIVAAGSVVPPGMKVPAGTMARGAPAKIVRELTAEERRLGIDGAIHYLELSEAHR
jgi:carbonic anhydrase/acetyltransferase-like protein (isoleucine patch superfamily)